MPARSLDEQQQQRVDTAGSGTLGAPAGAVGRIDSSNRARLEHSASFLHRILETFELKDGRDEVPGSVADVEKSLDRLYANLRGTSREET